MSHFGHANLSVNVRYRGAAAVMADIADGRWERQYNLLVLELLAILGVGCPAWHLRDVREG